MNCFGGANGTATVVAAAGTAPYTYIWSNGAITATITGLTAGTYELVFGAGDYLRASGQAGEGVLFLDEIPIRFGVPDATAHYHVPLLISPFGYSTYRGS